MFAEITNWKRPAGIAEKRKQSCARRTPPLDAKEGSLARTHEVPGGEGQGGGGGPVVSRHPYRAREENKGGRRSMERAGAE